MICIFLLIVTVIQAVPVQISNEENGTPKPTEVIYFGKVLPTDVNGRPVYPRVTRKGRVPYSLRYILNNPKLFPTEPSGKPRLYYPEDSPYPTDSEGNFVIPDGYANWRNGEIYATESDGRMAGYDLPDYEIPCGCIDQHEDGEHKK